MALLPDERRLIVIVAILLVTAATAVFAVTAWLADDSIAFEVVAEDLAVGDGPDVRVVETAGAHRNAMAESGLDIERPFEPSREVVIVFDILESSTCPFGAIRDLRYDDGPRRLYPVIERQPGDRDCTVDGNPHRVIVAVQRADLPSGELTVWLDEADPGEAYLSRIARFTNGA